MNKDIVLLGFGLMSPMAPLAATKIAINTNDLLIERRNDPDTQYVNLLSTEQSYDKWLLDSSSAKNVDNNRTLHADAAALCQLLYSITSKESITFYTKSFSDKHGYWISASDIEVARIQIFNPNTNCFCNDLRKLPLIDNKSGFFSKCMLHVFNGKIIEIAYVTKGTDFKTLRDWKANVEQGWSGNTQQYEISESNAKKIKELKRKIHITNKEIPLYFVGHSLGGGLATRNAVVTGLPAITFNASSLHPHTITSNRMNYEKIMQERKLLSFYIKDEVLSLNASGYVGLPKPGHRISLSPLGDTKRGSIDLHDVKHICNIFGLKSFTLHAGIMKYLCI